MGDEYRIRLLSGVISCHSDLSQYAVVKEPKPDSESGLEGTHRILTPGGQLQTSTIIRVLFAGPGGSLVDRRGVEPLTLALQRRRSTTELPAPEGSAARSRIALHRGNCGAGLPAVAQGAEAGAPGRTRTADLTLIRRVL